MSTTTRSPRSGSRSRKNPRTRAQRLTRVAELTERMDARQAEVEVLAAERSEVIDDLLTDEKKSERASFADIGRACGKSPQALHKAHAKIKARRAKAS